MLPLAELVTRAQTAHPGFQVRTITVPGEPGMAVVMAGDSGAVLVRNRANRVFLDPYSGDVLDAYMAWDLTAAQRWSHTADPLHFGTFAGLPSKLLYLAFGIALCVLQMAGTLVWWRRLRREKPAAAKAPRPVAVAPVQGWRPGGFAIAGIPVAAAIIWFGAQEVRDYLVVSPLPPAQILARTTDGPWTAELAHQPGTDGVAAIQLRLDCGPRCLPNPTMVTLLDGAGTAWTMARVQTRSNLAIWQVQPTGKPPSVMKVVVTAPDGTTHEIAANRTLAARDR